MAFSYGTPAGSTLSESVATSYERVFVQGAAGDVVYSAKKYAQQETKTEIYSSTLPALTTGTMSNGATVGYEYRETNTDEPRLTTTNLAWSTIP